MEMKEDAGQGRFPATKVATIQAATVYPIVSAYEFEFLGVEAAVRKRLDTCTIYLIAQRPLTVFDDVVTANGALTFSIKDGVKPPLRCRLDLASNGIGDPGEVLDIEAHFFSATPDATQPYRNVGALKVFRPDGSFAVWWSPQKFLYEVLVNGLKADLEGDPLSLLDFRVHYIGRSFSQKVWKRLTGHEKMQRILTMEGPLGASPYNRAPFEISLIMLEVVGLRDIPELPYAGVTHPPGVEPVLHTLDLKDDEGLHAFFTRPFVSLGDEALTREVEAILINRFRPAYNEIMFDNYPNIQGGMRAKGYTWTDLVIERLPAILFTDHLSMVPQPRCA